jgi:thioredoxin-like negative regulator of GroEL
MMSAFEQAAQLEPESIALQFRFAEAYYDMWQPDFAAALEQWRFIQEVFGDRLSSAEQNAIGLHLARCLAELGSYEEAKEIAISVEAPGFSETRDDLLEQIERFMEEVQHAE